MTRGIRSAVTATLPPGLSIRPAARGEWDALQDALRATVPPCAGEPAAWYAEAPEARQEAAQACSGCPALVPCARYADVAGEPAGVWGGRDRTRPAAARKVS